MQRIEWVRSYGVALALVGLIICAVLFLFGGIVSIAPVILLGVAGWGAAKGEDDATD